MLHLPAFITICRLQVSWFMLNLPAAALPVGALSELGRFYQANGPRSRLSEEVKGHVLCHLAAAEAALPPQEKSLLGF
jgi:hypothetical protein